MLKKQLVCQNLYYVSIELHKVSLGLKTSGYIVRQGIK